MRDLAIAVICFWGAVTTVQGLVKVPFAQWGTIQYLLAAMALALTALGVNRLVRVVKAFIGAQKRAQAQAQKLRAEADAERAAAEEDARDEEDS